MHLVDAKRLIKIQILRLYNEHVMSSRHIANYLNRLNPSKYRLNHNVSNFWQKILFNPWFNLFKISYFFKYIRYVAHSNVIHKKKSTHERSSWAKRIKCNDTFIQYIHVIINK